MKRVLLLALASLLLPASVIAAGAPSSFSAARSLLVASSSPGNVYAAGASVVLTSPVAADFSAIGGSVITAASIGGDSLLMGGSIDSRAAVGGDLRALGGSISVDESVKGDLVLLALSVHDHARAGGSVFIGAANAELDGGAAGAVSIYANNVALAGDFAGDVTIVSTGHVALASTTVIHGKLAYQAPEPAIIPDSAVIMGGVEYTNASYLPSASASRMLALASIGIFLLARVLGSLILAGLFAGLFPRLAEALADRASFDRPRRVLLTALLGFAALAATPVLLIFLALTFVGIGLALLVGIAYALLAFLAFIYAGILVGTLLVRRFVKRETVLWRDGVLGMFVLSLLMLVPVLGWAVLFLLMMFSAGALLLLFFHLAFPRENQTVEML